MATFFSRAAIFEVTGSTAAAMSAGLAADLKRASRSVLKRVDGLAQGGGIVGHRFHRLLDALGALRQAGAIGFMGFAHLGEAAFHFLDNSV